LARAQAKQFHFASGTWSQPGGVVEGGCYAGGVKLIRKGHSQVHTNGMEAVGPPLGGGNRVPTNPWHAAAWLLSIEQAYELDWVRAKWRSELPTLARQGTKG
jgi:hypothetical protein